MSSFFCTDIKDALGTLRKFDSPANTGKITSSTPDKETVEDLVTNMMAHQLHIPDLDRADIQSDEDESSGVSDAETEGQVKESEEKTKELNRDEQMDELPDRSQALSPSRSASTNEQVSPVMRSSQSRKMSAFGSFSLQAAGDHGDGSSKQRSVSNDDLRREVLATIMVKGMRGKNIIARGAAPAAQKNLQALDRKRAVELILDSEDLRNDSDGEDKGEEHAASRLESSRSKLALSLGFEISDVEIRNELGMVPPSEEDEAMESLRLLLIQNRVAQGTLSAESAALALAPIRTSSLNQVNSTFGGNLGDVVDSDSPQIDAGDVDPRLAGCGPLPQAVLSALILYKGGKS